MKLLTTASALAISALLSTSGVATAQSVTFETFDTDGDGMLSRKEWAQASEIRSKRIFRMASQGDRFITEEEFAEAIDDSRLTLRLAALRDKVESEDDAEAVDDLEDELREIRDEYKDAIRELKDEIADVGDDDDESRRELEDALAEIEEEEREEATA